MLQYKKLGFLVALIISMMLMSCRTITKIQEVPVETIKTQYVDKIQYDSIYQKDSIIIAQKGDTVYQTKTKYLYKYKYLKDTVNITDTIPKIVKTTEVQYINQLTSWQKWFIGIGIISILLIIIGIAYRIIKWLKARSV